jgi:hypothetical protein
MIPNNESPFSEIEWSADARTERQSFASKDSMRSSRRHHRQLRQMGRKNGQKIGLVVDRYNLSLRVSRWPHGVNTIFDTWSYSVWSQTLLVKAAQ